MSKSVLEKLVGAELSSVEFVRDYLQLHFDGPSLTCYAWPTVHVGDQSWTFTDGRYRDSLCGLISETVSSIAEDESALEVCFGADVKISVSLKRTDASPPELLYYRDGNAGWAVW